MCCTTLDNKYFEKKFENLVVDSINSQNFVIIFSSNNENKVQRGRISNSKLNFDDPILILSYNGWISKLVGKLLNYFFV
jgi:hypothetical protein